MHNDEQQTAVEEIKAFAKKWNQLYTETRFDDMKELATENIGIANASVSTHPSGLIFGRDAYKKGIYQAYYGASGNESNLLVMDYENWEYIPLDNNTFYTIGKYSLQPNTVGVNSWLLRREDSEYGWRIFRVINN